MSVIYLRPARKEDIPIIAALRVASFSDSPFVQAIFPERLRVKPGSQDRLDWISAQTENCFGKPFHHHIVAVDKATSGEETVVGLVEWRAPGAEESTDQQTPEERDNATEKTLAELPACIDKKSLLDAEKDTDVMIQSSEIHFRGQPKETMWMIHTIAVDDRHRRRGIGQMLTRWGMDKAQKNGQAVWLIASPSGRQLYESLGFKEVYRGTRCGSEQHVMIHFLDSVK